ncbi:MAG TPA: hypothetical protein VG501_05615 [Rhizomicrobium sp.]|nr:hypothetical protein [Rhizomicrobium sp.]
MNALIRTIGVGLFLLPTLARADDALAQFDDAIVSTEIMDKCQIRISGTVSYEKLHATGEAAYRQILGPLYQPKGDRDQAAEDADFILKKRTEADLAQGRSLVLQKGCPALVDHTRQILESYRD